MDGGEPLAYGEEVRAADSARRLEAGAADAEELARLIVVYGPARAARLWLRAAWLRREAAATGEAA